VYSVIERIGPVQAQQLEHGDERNYLKLYHKVGTTERTNPDERFREQSNFPPAKFKQILLGSMSDEEAHKRGFYSAGKLTL
jgi:hypothetical protein